MRTSKSSKSWNCKAKLCAPRQSDLSLWLLLEWLVLLLSWTHENKLPSQTWPSALTNLTVSGSHGWHEVGMSSVATPIAACNQIWFQHHSDKKKWIDILILLMLALDSQPPANHTFQASHLWCCPCRHLSTCRDISAETSESLESQSAFWKLSPPHSFALWSSIFQISFSGFVIA